MRATKEFFNAFRLEMEQDVNVQEIKKPEDTTIEKLRKQIQELESENKRLNSWWTDWNTIKQTIVNEKQDSLLGSQCADMDDPTIMRSAIESIISEKKKEAEQQQQIAALIEELERQKTQNGINLDKSQEEANSIKITVDVLEKKLITLFKIIDNNKAEDFFRQLDFILQETSWNDFKENIKREIQKNNSQMKLYPEPVTTINNNFGKDSCNIGMGGTLNGSVNIK